MDLQTPQKCHTRTRGGGGRGGRTVGGELDCEEEDTAVVGAALRTHDRGLPLEQIVALRPRAAIGGGVALQVLQLAADAFLCHLQNFMCTARFPLKLM